MSLIAIIVVGPPLAVVYKVVAHTTIEISDIFKETTLLAEVRVAHDLASVPLGRCIAALRFVWMHQA
jgi:hypothetical protein